MPGALTPRDYSTLTLTDPGAQVGPYPGFGLDWGNGGEALAGRPPAYGHPPGGLARRSTANNITSVGNKLLGRIKAYNCVLPK